MPQRRGGTARREFNDMLVAFVVTVQITKRALDAVALAWPRPDFHRFHVLDVDASDQRRALALAPLLVHVGADNGRLLFRI